MTTAPQTAQSQPAPPDQLRPLGAARLSGELMGTSDDRPPLVLLHGLTFDRRMWQPAVAALRQRDPGRVVLALDLPGHGGSPMQDRCDLDDVAAAIASAVEDAGLDAPVVVGHSISGVIATRYAVAHPTRGVVNVDAALDTAVIRMLQANRDALVGPGFAAVWRGLLASMHVELLADSARQLLNTDVPRQDIFLAYQRQALVLSEAELQEWIAQTLGTLRQRSVPYAIIAGHDYDDAYTAWLHDTLPQATVTVFPNSGHFPHLADPERFATCLAATAHWEGR
jgi:pimeloyl-ACP methyl ester carboxylesterase